MKKKLSALEELRKNTRKEEILTKKAKVALPILTAEKIELFIDGTVFQAFEQIEREIKPFYKKVRIQKYKQSVSFYVSESTSDYYCSIKLAPRIRTVEFSSRYKFPAKSKNPRIKTSTILLHDARRQTQNLSEITVECIIKLFNKSFFERIRKMKKSIEKSKEARYYDDNGEMENPYDV
jgi:DNA polymerase II small subunit/DNA polymerase delta subunit B